ncbi:MAG: carboxypeptidase regulatory-like domain-containing protein, partial [Planctomycetota bacterium]
KTLTIAITISQPHEPDKPYTKPEKVEKSGKIAEDGTFSLEPLDGGIVSIEARTDEYMPIKSRQLRFQSGKYVIPLRFVLAGTIKGVVVDAGNKDALVPDAEVYVGNNHATTDEKGCFEIKGLSPVSHHVYVLKWQMMQETEPQTIDVASGKTTEVKIRMVRRKGFKCRLLKPDGKPLASTRVVIEMEASRDDRTYSRSFGEERWRGTQPATDADGYLLFEEIESGHVTLKIYVAKYKPVETEEHEAKPGESWEIKEPIKLDSGLELEVVVRDTAGKPVPSAKVITRAVKDGHKHYMMSQIFTDVDDNAELAEAILPPPPPVKEPVPGEEPVHPQEKKPNLPGMADTDEKGVAKAAGLPEGDVAVIAVKPGYIVSEQKIVTLKKGETKKIEITLEKEATAKVKIIDADTKQPVPRAYTCAYTERDFGEQPVIDVESVSNFRPVREDGPATWTIRGIRAGKVTISASADGYHDGTFDTEFKPGEKKQITIEMKKFRDGALAGTIRPAATMPMSGIFCALLSRSDVSVRYDYGEMPIVLRLDRKGRFNVPNIREGRWDITVLGMDNRPLVEKDFEIEPDKKTDIALQLQALGTLDIELVDHEGKPLAGAQLGLTGPGSTAPFLATSSTKFFYLEWGNIFVTTDEEGKCKFESLLPGVYRLSKISPLPQHMGIFLIPLMWKVTIKADKTEKVKFRVPKTTTIEGTLTARHDRLCTVSVFRQAATFLEMFIMPVAIQRNVKPGAKFKVEGVPPGKLVIVAVTKGDMLVSSYTMEIEVKEGVPVKGIELKFPEKTQKISGKLKDYKGKPSPAPDGIIIFYGPALASAKVNPDGTFELEMPPGKYKVHRIHIRDVKSGEQPAPKPIEITIEEGKDLTGIEVP